jgi:hypothetical protein
MKMDELLKEEEEEEEEQMHELAVPGLPFPYDRQIKHTYVHPAFWLDTYRILATCGMSFAAPSLVYLFNSITSKAGILQICHSGQEGLHNILITNLLGPSLEDLLDMCGRKFSIKAVLFIRSFRPALVLALAEQDVCHAEGSSPVEKGPQAFVSPLLSQLCTPSFICPSNG